MQLRWGKIVAIGTSLSVMVILLLLADKSWKKVIATILLLRRLRETEMAIPGISVSC